LGVESRVGWEATHRIVGPSDEHLVRVALEALEEAVLLVVPKELALHKLELGNLLTAQGDGEHTDGPEDVKSSAFTSSRVESSRRLVPP
jgi:hypothetical protein